MFHHASPKGELLIFSQYTSDNQRLMLFNQNHTILSTFQPKNVGFQKDCFKISRLLESIFGMQDSITSDWGSIVS